MTRVCLVFLSCRRSLITTQSPSALCATQSPSALCATQSPSALCATQSPGALCVTQSPSALCATQSPSALCVTQSPSAFCVSVLCHQSWRLSLVAMFSAQIRSVSSASRSGHHGLTFTWWGCCKLCQRHEPAVLAHSFLYYSCVCFCLYGPFNFISIHEFS